VKPQALRRLSTLALAGLVAGFTGAAVADPPRSRPAGKPSQRGPARADAGPCKAPPAAAKLKVSLKPDTEIADLIVWYANLTCTSLLLSNGVATAGKKVTLLTPTPVTRAELHRLFIAALDSVGLTVEPDGRFLRVIESARARHSNTPVDPSRADPR
jgi:general secretion pathway protein D